MWRLTTHTKAPHAPPPHPKAGVSQSPASVPTSPPPVCAALAPNGRPRRRQTQPKRSLQTLNIPNFFSLSLTACDSKVSREEKEYEISLRGQIRPRVLKSPPDYLAHTHTRSSTVPIPQQGATSPSWVPGRLSLGAGQCASFCTRPTRIPHPCPRPGLPVPPGMGPGCQAACGALCTVHTPPRLHRELSPRAPGPQGPPECPRSRHDSAYLSV